MTGGDAAEVQRGRPEEERDHHALPGHAERHSGPNRGAQQPQHQAVPGEQRPGWEAQGSHFTIWSARGGSDPKAHQRQAKLWGFHSFIFDLAALQNLEKVFKHRDLKEKLLETKLTQANMIQKEAEEKHRLEKELVPSAFSQHVCASKPRKLIFLPTPHDSTDAQTGFRVQDAGEGHQGAGGRYEDTGASMDWCKHGLSLLSRRQSWCFPLLLFLLSLTCTPRSLMKSKVPSQRVTASTAASNRTWTKWECLHRIFDASGMTKKRTKRGKKIPWD